jgi:hypothetical protein
VGPKKIAGYLASKGYVVDNNQAYRIICEAGLNHPITASRKTWGTNASSESTTTAYGKLTLSYVITTGG